MTIAPAAPPAQRSPSRVFTWLAAAAALAAAASVYAPIASGVLRQWLDDADAAYGAIVAMASVLAVRRRWPQLRATPIGGSWWGAAVVVVAVGCHTVGVLAADVFTMRLSLVLLCTGAVWMLCGSAHLRLLAAPLILMFIAIPLPSALVTELTLPLQLAASQCAEGLLHLTGTPVVRDGNVLTLNYITLEVAEACSGMRSLVTLVALVAVAAVTCGLPPRRTVLLAAAAIPVAIVGNGLRVAATALMASRIGDSATRGVVHDATGWAAFVVMCAALVAVHGVASRAARSMEAAA